MNVPYFKDFKELNKENAMKYKDVDDFLYSHLDILTFTKINITDFNMDDNEHVMALPDGTYSVYEANEKVLSYIVRVNDGHRKQYRRNNGISGVTMKFYMEDTKSWVTVFDIRASEGLAETASIINNAYIKSKYNTTVVSGIQYMPF